MYLLTRSETLKNGVTVTFTSSAGNNNIIDGDLMTGAETTVCAPNLTVTWDLAR